MKTLALFLSGLFLFYLSAVAITNAASFSSSDAGEHSSSHASSPIPFSMKAGDMVYVDSACYIDGHDLIMQAGKEFGMEGIVKVFRTLVEYDICAIFPQPIKFKIKSIHYEGVIDSMMVWRLHIATVEGEKVVTAHMEPYIGV
jgi:hypothetical protein